MILRILLIAAGLALAAYGAYVLFGRGEVVRVEAPKVAVSDTPDSASVTVEKPKVTVE